MIKLGLTMAVFDEMYDSWAEMWQPGGIGYLASYLAACSPTVEVIVDRDLDNLIAQRPDIVGLSATTYCYGFARDNARKIKESLGIPVIVGGPHVTLAVEHLNPIFDVAVLGEGEETLLALMELFAATKRFEPQDLTKVSGIAFWAEGKLQRTPARKPIESLDRIPFRARELLHQWGEVSNRANLYASRGCPYTCKFCSTVQVWGRNVRRHSACYIADEIQFLREKFDTRHFFFNDDLFSLQEPWVESIAATLKERDILDGISIRCTAHVKTMTDRMMTALASMNVKILDIGLESGSSHTLQILGKAATREDNEQAMTMLRKYGIAGDSCFILGAPGERREDVHATFEFLYRNLDVFDDIAFGPVMPLPGTPVFGWAQEKFGTTYEDLILRPEDLTDWDRYVFTRYPYLNADNMPLEEMVNYVKIGRALAKTLPGHIGEAYIDPRIGEHGKPNTLRSPFRRALVIVERGGKGEQQIEGEARPASAA